MSRFTRVGLVVASLMSLGACATAEKPYGNYAGVVPIAEDSAVIDFREPVFGGQASLRARYVDPTQVEEYARYETKGEATGEAKGAQAEFHYLEALKGIRTVLEFSTSSRLSLQEWNLPGKDVQLIGDSRRIQTDLPFYAQKFQLVDTDRSCFSFHAEWDLDVDDVSQRYDKALIGYICAPPGRDFGSGDMPSVLANVKLRGITANHAFGKRLNSDGKILPPPQHDVELAQKVTTGDETITMGSRLFPARAVYYFPNTDGSEKILQ